MKARKKSLEGVCRLETELVSIDGQDKERFSSYNTLGIEAAQTENKGLGLTTPANLLFTLEKKDQQVFVSRFSVCPS